MATDETHEDAAGAAADALVDRLTEHVGLIEEHLDEIDLLGHSDDARR